MVRTEPCADAKGLQRLERPCPQHRVRRQTEIVVRGKIDDLTMVNRRVRRLLAVEHAQAAIQTLLPQIVQGLVQVGERVLTHVRAILRLFRITAGARSRRCPRERSPLPRAV
jgi:hypothetical protein